VQLPPLAADAIEPHGAIAAAPASAVAVVAEFAKIIAGFAHMQQFARHQFDHDDVVETSDDGDVTREYVIRMVETDEEGSGRFGEFQCVPGGGARGPKSRQL